MSNVVINSHVRELPGHAFVTLLLTLSTCAYCVSQFYQTTSSQLPRILSLRRQRSFYCSRPSQTQYRAVYLKFVRVYENKLTLTLTFS